MATKTGMVVTYHEGLLPIKSHDPLIKLLFHGTIILTGITYKKTPCYMRDSACRWFIVKKAKIF